MRCSSGRLGGSCQKSVAWRAVLTASMLFVSLAYGCQSETPNAATTQETDFWAEDFSRQFFEAKSRKDWHAVYALLEPAARSQVRESDYVACLGATLGTQPKGLSFNELKVELDAQRAFLDDKGRPVWSVTADLRGVAPPAGKSHWDEVMLVYEKGSWWVMSSADAKSYKGGARCSLAD